MITEPRIEGLEIYDGHIHYCIDLRKSPDPSLRYNTEEGIIDVIDNGVTDSVEQPIILARIPMDSHVIIIRADFPDKQKPDKDEVTFITIPPMGKKDFDSALNKLIKDVQHDTNEVLKSLVIPKWVECAELVTLGMGSSLERFIFVHEPANLCDKAIFRDNLLAVLIEARNGNQTKT